MRKFMTVFATEYGQVVKKKSFLVGIFLTPVFLVLVTVLPSFFAERRASTTAQYAIIDADGRGVAEAFTQAVARYKLDDDSTKPAYELTMIYRVASSDSIGLDTLRTVLDSAVLTKQLKYYVVIYPGVERNDSVLLVSKSLNFNTARRFDWNISNILAKTRLESSNINLPVDSVMAMTRRIDMLQGSPGGKTREFLTVYLGAFIFIMIIFTSVLGFGQILMRSVLEEKTSRVMEVLVSSVSPFQLMMGKVTGLGAASLTQIAIWVVIGLVLFSNRAALQIPVEVADIVFNPVLIFYFVLFLIIAYFMYATLFAFIGSICNSDKEAQNFMFPIVISLMLPVFLMMYIIQEPESTVSVILSLIPILTPTMMMARLNIINPGSFSLADPIILEATIGVVVSALFTVFFIWITGRVFRIGILMYGKRPTLPEIIKWVRYK
jgi:ABC-2 type transport system permease protein